MKYLTLAGRSLDTNRDLDQAGRHVAQKLIFYERLGLSPREFAQRRQRALAQGWNQSGPLTESPALKALADDLARRLALGRQEGPGPGWLKAQVYPGRYQGGGLKPQEPGEDSLGLAVIDAADQDQGRIEVERKPQESLAEAAARAAAELARGDQTLTGKLRALSLKVRN